MKKLISTLLFACSLALGAQAQILESANPQADSAAFARVRERMDSIRQYRPTVGLVLAGGGALLTGLDKRIGDTLGIPCRMEEAPQACAVKGLSEYLEHTSRYERTLEWALAMVARR